ncbi:MAG: sigma 54-interacting transcriptional regulator [Deltaproteobacteria bacterium]|nr:sigma 54-interacting transcriptional regulator [Deltaproteobacteria bacterium]
MELVVLRGSQELVTLPLDRDAFRIGRAGTNDLAVPEPTVSRMQCEIRRTDGRLLLVDTSGNGTEVDGKRRTEVEIGPGSRIGFGALTVTLRSRPEAPVAETTLSSGQRTDVLPAAFAAHPPGGLFLVSRDERRKLKADSLTLGADKGNDWPVDDPYASSFHCRLVRKPEDGSWHVLDLDSTNGTFINGVQVGEARLEPGSVLRIGQAEFRLETEQGEVGFCGIVSESPAMERVFDLIRRAAPTDETVLITGESGSGKELVARALHALSRRASHLLVPLNCSAVTKNLLESELFGHEKGAFTGASVRRKGLFEQAHGGTLFLDEIGELVPDLQAKLLRVLENGEVRPVGSDQPRHVDTRVLAATHRSLPEQVQTGAFREDLYYRICVIEIRIPPLRERPQDIPLLARFFLDQSTRQTGARRFSDAAIDRMSSYRFPGNVRELKHAVTRAAIMSTAELIEADDLSFAPPTLADRVAESKIYRPGKTLRDVEIETIRQAMQANDFNQKAAARDLGIARSTLHQKIDRYKIPRGRSDELP